MEAVGRALGWALASVAGVALLVPAARARGDEVLREVVTLGGPVVGLPVAAPPGSDAVVRLRTEGSQAPALLAVLDLEGAELPFRVRRRAGGRVRVARVRVPHDGHFELVLAPTGSTYPSSEIVVSTRRARKAPTSPRLPERWVAGRVVLGTFDPANTLPPDVAAELGLDSFTLGDGILVAETPFGRGGRELQDALLLAALLRAPVFVEPDAWAEPPDGSQANDIVVGSDFGRSFPHQPALRRIDALAAHGRTRGRGVTVAVLDTGIDATHPLFEGRLLPGRDFVDLDDDPAEEQDGFDQDGDGQVDEGHGHGTFVAGVVLAVAPEAKILPIRVLDSDARGAASGIAAGIRHAVDSGADVVNLSLGTRIYSGVLGAAVDHALSRGVIVVAAAGNSARRQGDFPASEIGVLSVAALSRGGRRAGFSNPGAIAAPGTRIVGPFPGATWGRANGTSFAAPLVSGAVALHLELHPDPLPKDVHAAITHRSRLALSGLSE